MKIIYNNVIPFKGFKAINLFSVVFARKDVPMCKYNINHELIHTAQMKELYYIPFYILYLTEWVYRLFKTKFNFKQAYKEISFEKEAYNNERNFKYLNKRTPFAMWNI